MIFCENLRNVLCNIKCGPYFLGKEAQERELEKALIDRIRDFLLELGVGFALNK
jgi:predicted nuclease of restriction endonuclease-like (RecB) superfamily